MGNLVKCISLVLLCLTPSLPAIAAPVLLETFQASTIGRSTGNPELSPEGVVFHLGYDSSDCAQLVGCERVWNLKETGSLDFDAGNSANFSAVTAALTDNIAEFFWVGAHTINAGSALIFPGGATGSPDSTSFAGLVGASIDFFRLTVTETTLTGAGTSSSSHSYRGNFEVWGVPAPVPLPAAAWLFGSAMLGLIASGRRRA